MVRVAVMAIDINGIEIPASLAARPRDPRRGVPVPWVNVVADNGEVDFTAVDGSKSLRCATERLCSLCGEPIGYWVGFLGGTKCVESRAYLDPPMHPECGEAAMKLCPYIAISHARRRVHPITNDSIVPGGWVADRPDKFVLYITRSYRWQLVRAAETGEPCLIFRPAPPKELREAK